MTTSGPRTMIRVPRFAGALVLILAVWFAALTMVPRLRDEAGQYLVIGPQAVRLAAVAGTDASVISGGRGYLQVESARSGLVADLYAHGAWLVLPASNGGCLRLTDWKRLIGAP